MPQRHEFGQPLDSDLLQDPMGVYDGAPHEAIGKIIVSRVGIATFPERDLELVAADLGSRGYMPANYTGNSQVSAGPNGSPGEIHRHDDESVIVHRTLSGTGKANFFWPVQDDQGFDPDFLFDPGRDVVHLSADRIPLNPARIIVFPANAWHQFNTDANQKRISKFRHYRPVA